jgi:hypothetical protein
VVPSIVIDNSKNEMFSLLKNVQGATTFILITFSIMTLSIKGLFTTLSRFDTQHKSTRAIMLSVIMSHFNVSFYLL